MKSHHQFLHEINKLYAFYIVTLYSYEQTDNLFSMWRVDRTSFEKVGLDLKPPILYKNKKRAKLENKKNLSEIIFVRIVSALEVFLVDIIRDVFISTKEPFKKQDVIIQFTQAELLSIHSPADIFNKIINKELRKLTSGGFSDIQKYYKRHFDIELNGFTPGKIKMEEYHERRHLLVHRLGKTDQMYREKYDTKAQSISVSEDYLMDCIQDFKDFADLINTQLKYKLTSELLIPKSKKKIIEAKHRIDVEILIEKEPEFFAMDYEFWAGDQFSMVSNILDIRTQIDVKKFQLVISGTERQIISYSRILRQGVAADEIKVKFKKMKTIYIEPNEPIFLDEKIIKKIKEKLPEQPWPTGIHKIIAAELGVSNKMVSGAIQQLIGKGVFKNQFEGKVIE